MMDNSVIKIEGLSKTFTKSKKGITITQKLKSLLSRHKEVFKVLDNLNLEITKGEFVGLIGKNGSGKSTLLKIILGAIEPDKGSMISTKGKIIRLALGMGFDSSLSARDNIYLNGAIIGLSFKKIGEIFNKIIQFSELEEFIDTPLRYYSSGMVSRLAFSIAIHAEADIFLIDEFFNDVGDSNFKEKSNKVFDGILKDKTIIYVSHTTENLIRYCDRVLVLKDGNTKNYTDINLAIKDYKS